MNDRMKTTRKTIINNTLFICKMVLLGILIAVLLRVFFMASFKIPTPSMWPAIQAGDFVLASKQTPGPRIITNFFSLPKGGKPEVKRIKGWRQIRRNDVLVFNYPYSDWGKLDFDWNVFYG